MSELNKNEEKILPEINVSADNQIIWAGIGVVALLFVALGWNSFFGSDLEEDNKEQASDSVDIDDEEEIAPASDTKSSEIQATTTTAEDGFLEVQPLVAPLAGDVTATRSNNEVSLTGFVASSEEKTEAEKIVLELEDVEKVNNQLVILKPQALAELENNEVVNPSVSGKGQTLTIKGSVASETESEAIEQSVRSIEGVKRVVNNLTVSAVDVINNLPQVQFASGSSRILAVSFPELDKAAELLSNANVNQIEVQGYTDTTGDEEANERLSQNRADAVRSYLISKDVDPSILTAKGYGETTQFAAGETEEAYEENRKVLLSEVE